MAQVDVQETARNRQWVQFRKAEDTCGRWFLFPVSACLDVGNEIVVLEHLALFPDVFQYGQLDEPPEVAAQASAATEGVYDDGDDPPTRGGNQRTVCRQKPHRRAPSGWLVRDKMGGRSLGVTRAQRGGRIIEPRSNYRRIPRDVTWSLPLPDSLSLVEDSQQTAQPFLRQSSDHQPRIQHSQFHF